MVEKVPDTSAIMPRISVIVPAYNNPDVLEQCLAALRTAAYSDVEIIVVDDASTEDIAWVAGLGIRQFRLTKNSGPGAARNYGARYARGEVLTEEAGKDLSAKLALTDAQEAKLFWVAENGAWTLVLRPPKDPSDSPEGAETYMTLLKDGIRASQLEQLWKGVENVDEG